MSDLLAWALVRRRDLRRRARLRLRRPDALRISRLGNGQQPVAILDPGQKVGQRGQFSAQRDLHQRSVKVAQRLLLHDLGADKLQAALAGQRLEPLLELGRGQGRGGLGDEARLQGRELLAEVCDVARQVGSAVFALTHLAGSVGLALNALLQALDVGPIRIDHAVAQDGQHQNRPGQSGQQAFPA